MKIKVNTFNGFHNIKFKYVEDGESFSAIHFNGEYRVKLETHICV